jgi:type III secretion system YscI/HrpB-like protein
MTAVVLTNLGNSGSILGAGSSPFSGRSAEGVSNGATSHLTAGAEQRFYAALEKASSDTTTVSPAASANAPAGGAPQSSAAAEADQGAQERARRGLQLEPSAAGAKRPQSGDAVLDGLQKLRGMFDTHEARLSGLMSKTTPNIDALLSMQVEVVNFTVLVDVTSKLTGQSTQAFQTLLNGQ